MNLYKAKFGRLVELDRRIRAGKCPNCTAFGKEWEVSRKTIQRDIDFLRYSLGAPIEYDSKAHGYRYTDRTWSLPTVDLSESELLNLLIAERMAAQFQGTPLAKTLATMFEKLSAILPERVSLDPTWLSAQVSFHAQPVRPVSETVWSAALAALRGTQVLKIEYRRPDWKNAQSRNIEPVHLASLGGEWHLVAYCREEKSMRQFALSRMLTAKATGIAFDPPAFDPIEYFSNSFMRWVSPDGRTHKIEVRFTAEAAPWALERVWHQKQRVRHHRGGGATIVFPAPDLGEVARWVMRWGAEAEVLRPEQLRTAVAAEALRMVRIYS